MRPMDLVRRLRREAAFEPAALERGRAVLMAAIRQEVEHAPRPSIVPQVPYEDIGAALVFLQHAFGFREIPSSRILHEEAVIHAMVEVGDGVIGIGSQGAHGARSPQSTGMASQYITVYIDDVQAHYQRALAAGARIARDPREHSWGDRSYEALDPEGHRWRFYQRTREAPRI
jgi:uncharacterized glyoxalase superfamily protein PhnB